MKILVLGGTRFFGIDMVNALLENGHDVTLAIRGNTKAVFGLRVSYIFLDRHDEASVKAELGGKYFDVVIDKIAYVQNIMDEQPMYIDNMDSRMSFISCEEAGGFFAYLTAQAYEGAINGANEGTVSVGEIVGYVCRKTGRQPVLSENGIAMPYNGTADYSINTNQAKSLGWQFADIHTWIFKLLDYYIACDR